MRKKNLTKAVESTIAPNPKEVDIWVEPKDDDTVSLKYYDYHDEEWKGDSVDAETPSLNAVNSVMMYYNDGTSSYRSAYINKDGIVWKQSGVELFVHETTEDKTVFWGAHGFVAKLSFVLPRDVSVTTTNVDDGSEIEVAPHYYDNALDSGCLYKITLHAYDQIIKISKSGNSHSYVFSHRQE